MLLKSLENKLRIKLRNQRFVLEKRVISSNPYRSGCYRPELVHKFIEAGENFALTMDDIIKFVEE